MSANFMRDDIDVSHLREKASVKAFESALKALKREYWNYKQIYVSHWVLTSKYDALDVNGVDCLVYLQRGDSDNTFFPVVLQLKSSLTGLKDHYSRKIQPVPCVANDPKLPPLKDQIIAVFSAHIDSFVVETVVETVVEVIKDSEKAREALKKQDQIRLRIAAEQLERKKYFDSVNLRFERCRETQKSNPMEDWESQALANAMINGEVPFPDEPSSVFGHWQDCLLVEAAKIQVDKYGFPVSVGDLRRELDRLYLNHCIRPGYIVATVEGYVSEWQRHLYEHKPFRCYVTADNGRTVPSRFRRPEYGG